MELEGFYPKLKQRLRIIKPSKTEAVPAHKSLNSPQELLSSDDPIDQKMAELVRNSFYLRNHMGISHFHNIADQNEIYMCKPKADEPVKAALWFKPYWKESLDAFAKFALNVAGERGVLRQGDSLHLVASDHITDEKRPEYESVILTPILINSKGEYSTGAYYYSIKPDGSISFGNANIGFHSLGNIDPEAASAKALADWNEEKERLRKGGEEK